MLKNSATRRRRLQLETLEDRRVLAAYISEIHHDPLFGSNSQDQYVEFRGEPGAVIEDGTYFLGIESADGVDELGDIHTIIDLGGVAFGSNGYLALVQSVANNGVGGYEVDTAGNVLEGTDGFLGLPGDIFEADDGAKEIHAGSSTFLLVKTAVQPTLADDIDANDDGIPDGPYLNWEILDGVAVMPWVENPFTQRTYAPIVFTERGVGESHLPTATVIETDSIAYAGRIGGSIGYTDEDWMSGNTVEDNTDQFDFQFQHGTFGTPRPKAYGGRILDHVGGPNWFGSVSGYVFEDLNSDGFRQSNEPGVNGVQLGLNHQNAEDYFWEVIEPDDYDVGTDVSNISKHVTSISAGDDNVPQGFKNEVVQESFAPDGQHIFSHAGVGFFNEVRRMRMDFYRPVRTVQIDVIGNSDLSSVYGRLEIFNKAGDSLGFVRTNALAAGVRQTLTLTSSNDDIAWALAYSEDSYLDSSPFGKLDHLRILVPRENAETNADGKYSFTTLIDDTYQVGVIDSGAFYQTSPANNGSRGATVNDASSVTGVDFGFRPRSAPDLRDALYSMGELADAGTVVSTLPVVTGYTGQDLEFQILSGDAEGQFEIDNENRQLKVAKGDLDFESVDQFVLVVEVADAVYTPLKDTATITINVTDQNEAPVVDDDSATIDENSVNATEVATMSANDPDAGLAGEVMWSIVDGNVGDAFAIDPDTGAVSVADETKVNFETSPTFSLTVRATDKGSPVQFGEALLTVSLNDLDEVPEILEDPMAIDENSVSPSVVGQLAVKETDAGETISWSIGGEDAAFFEVRANGEVIVAEGTSLNFEAKDNYILDVTVSDSADPPNTDDAQITIAINDVNDAPQIEGQHFTLDENTAAGFEIGVAEASDEDDGQTVSFSLEGADEDKFDIDPLTGSIVVAEGAVLDFETANAINLDVVATDSHDPSAATSALFTIDLNDINEAPTIDESPLSIEENSDAGVELPVSIVDPDAGDTLTVEIVEQTQDWFTLNQLTGRLEVKSGADIDFETDPEMTLVLTVTDAQGLTSTGTITVTATDENDPPQLDNPVDDLSADVGSAFEFVIPEDTFSDQDPGDTLTYSVSVVGGGELPAWLSFDAPTRTLSGTPAADDVTTHVFKLTVADDLGAINSDGFNLEVKNSLPWHNTNLSQDVTDDGVVAPRDALLVINYVNSAASPEVPADQPPEDGFLDVNGDNFVTPIDALIVINFLNTGGGSAEGEYASNWSYDELSVASDEADGLSDDLLAALASEQLRLRR